MNLKMTDLKRVVGALLVLGIFLCAVEIGGVNGQYCGGRDCSNVCRNNTCQKFLYECKYGCKSGRNIAACPQATPAPAEKPPAANIGLVVGVSAGVVGVVVVCVIIVAVVVVRRRRERELPPPSTNVRTKHIYEIPSIQQDEMHYMELDDVRPLPATPPCNGELQPPEYELPVN